MISFGLAPAAQASAAEADTPDEVGTAAEFIDWLDDHYWEGGSVVFTDTIRITSADVTGYTPRLAISRWSYGSGLLLIDTASYGLITEIDLTVGIETYITGSGAQLPVIHVLDGASLTLDPWIENSVSSVTATDDGGVAVYCDEGAFFNCNPMSLIRAEGTNGIAFYAEGDCVDDPFDQGIGFFGGTFEATGAGGRGIVCGAPVTLFLCEVRADATAVEAPAVFLDTCGEILPDVDNATGIRRTLVVEGFYPDPGKLLAGDYKALMRLEDPGVAGYAFLEYEGFPDRFINAYATFDISLVDIETPGTYPLPGTVASPYGFALNDLADFEVEVIDASVPRYHRAMANWGGSYMFIFTFAGDVEDLVLWRSDDMGETWYQYWVGTEGRWINEGVNVDAWDTELSIWFAYPADELPGEVLFVFENVALGMDSKTLYVNFSEREFLEDIGGDRTGADRDPGVTDDDRGSGNSENDGHSGNTTPPGTTNGGNAGNGGNSVNGGNAGNGSNTGNASDTDNSGNTPPPSDNSGSNNSTQGGTGTSQQGAYSDGQSSIITTFGQNTQTSSSTTANTPPASSTTQPEAQDSSSGPTGSQPGTSLTQLAGDPPALSEPAPFLGLPIWLVVVLVAAALAAGVTVIGYLMSRQRLKDKVAP